MADKPRDWSGLNVNFQNLPPKAGDPQWITWIKVTVIWLLFVGALRLLAWLV